MTPEWAINVVLKHRNKRWVGKISTNQTVAQFKKFINRVLRIPPPYNYTLMYEDLGLDLGPETIKSNIRMMHSFRINEGDEFYIVDR